MNDVLAAARRLFAERGYRATTVRSVAAAAGVTSAMVHHFFGSKQQLFLAAVRMPINPVEILATLAQGPRPEFPRRLVTTFVTLWSDQAIGPALQGVMRSALNDPERARAFRTFADTVLLPMVAERLAVPPERVGTALSIMLGMAFTRYLVGIPTLANLSDEQVIEHYVPSVAAALFR